MSEILFVVIPNKMPDEHLLLCHSVVSSAFLSVQYRFRCGLFLFYISGSPQPTYRHRCHDIGAVIAQICFGVESPVRQSICSSCPAENKYITTTTCPLRLKNISKIDKMYGMQWVAKRLSLHSTDLSDRVSVQYSSTTFNLCIRV